MSNVQLFAMQDRQPAKDYIDPYVTQMDKSL